MPEPTAEALAAVDNRVQTHPFPKAQPRTKYQIADLSTNYSRMEGLFAEALGQSGITGYHLHDVLNAEKGKRQKVLDQSLRLIRKVVDKLCKADVSFHNESLDLPIAAVACEIVKGEYTILAASTETLEKHATAIAQPFITAAGGPKSAPAEWPEKTKASKPTKKPTKKRQPTKLKR